MDYIKVNKDAWDKRTEIHVKSRFYDVDGFLAGKSSLQEIELNEVGCVKDKTLLHLQCHFGLDSLSWARMGAEVTGVDLSPMAIEQAVNIAKQAKLKARFICTDLYSFGRTPKASKDVYDIVFTSYGVVCWLPDLIEWADIVVRHLKPGGMFYMAEFHPFYDLVSGYSYFHKPEPDIEDAGTYTENDIGETSTLAMWSHPISDVLNALTSAGLRITQFNEYPYSPYNCFDGLVERKKGKFYLTHKNQDVPLIYSLKGIKP
ncbi:class I SAM-dependent methyltransferase [Agarilytica rhodophyticola]|uniref:class I SAM-dependent methyltransferase n=1 Tax=Agarilytica rhodophyticola TaxID=1737490 RepID=UPI000B343F73|nr:class I SAM-dependent methyltransferase [Agarilytica rhodophyticola]